MGNVQIIQIIPLVLAVFMIVTMWKVFAKAGQPGLCILIPIFNIYLLLKNAGKPGWWMLLLLIPIVNIFTLIMMNIGIANNFGKGAGFAIGLILFPFIFYPILAFGSAKYQA